MKTLFSKWYASVLTFEKIIIILKAADNVHCFVELHLILRFEFSGTEMQVLAFN